MDSDYYVNVDGVRIPKVFGEENFRSAAKYIPRDGGLFVVSHPKCGTSWVQYIVCSILTRGKPPNNVEDLNAMAPFIDVSGAAAEENPKRTGPIVTHIPPRLLPPNDRLGYCNYFDHLLPWYDVREKHNVLFITYEQLKADTKGQILRIADFIGSDHGAILREDTDTLKENLREVGFKFREEHAMPQVTKKVRLKESSNLHNFVALLIQTFDPERQPHQGYWHVNSIMQLDVLSDSFDFELRREPNKKCFALNFVSCAILRGE
nr:sulfotransferase 2A8-like [Dermacentor andersoni]